MESLSPCGREAEKYVVKTYFSERGGMLLSHFPRYR